jgi:hypothetical protein
MLTDQFLICYDSAKNCGARYPDGRTTSSSIDMYNNDVGQDLYLKFPTTAEVF